MNISIFDVHQIFSFQIKGYFNDHFTICHKHLPTFNSLLHGNLKIDEIIGA